MLNDPGVDDSFCPPYFAAHRPGWRQLQVLPHVISPAPATLTSFTTVTSILRRMHLPTCVQESAKNAVLVSAFVHCLPGAVARIGIDHGARARLDRRGQRAMRSFRIPLPVDDLIEGEGLDDNPRLVLGRAPRLNGDQLVIAIAGNLQGRTSIHLDHDVLHNRPCEVSVDS